MNRRGFAAATKRPKAPSDPVVTRFRAAPDEIYGDAIDRVVLFGSRARGEAQAASDYDIALFLKSFSDRWDVLDRLLDVKIDFMDKHGAFFDVQPFSATAYDERTPIMHEIRDDGLDV